MRSCLIILFFLTSCYSSYDLKLRDVTPTLVVDGWLKDLPGQSVIRFGWTASSAEEFSFDAAGSPPANPLADVPCTIKATLSDDHNFQSQFEVSMPWKKGGVEWIIENFTGTPGRKYVLEIEVLTDGHSELYTSETWMLHTPPITAIDYEIRKAPVDKENQFVPLISFNEPQNERNYYLFSLCESAQADYTPIKSWGGCNYNNRIWNYSLLPDTFLPASVTRLSVDDGNSPTKGLQFYPPVNGTGDGVLVLMYSIDERAYQYYKSLAAQYDYDGGAYFPTPSTNTGNISNGAMGLFRATQVSGAAVFMK